MAESTTVVPERMRRFAEEYLVDLNAAAAYKRAGYKVTTERAAFAAASRLLTNVKVQMELRAARERQEKRLALAADKTLQEHALIAFSDIGEIIDFSGPQPKLRPANEIPAHARRAIASMKVSRVIYGSGNEAKEVEVTEFKLWNKIEALNKLGLHQGLWNAQGGTQVVVNIIGGVDLAAIVGDKPGIPYDRLRSTGSN